MIGILSIDFDYFIEASSEERDIYFPKGSDELPVDMLNYMWKERYLKHPKLRSLGLIKDYYLLKNYLLSLKIHKDNFYVADSHKSIKKLIDKLPWNLQLKIVNIDFHHDYYHYYRGGDYYNCGNWLRRVIEERPGTKVKWIRRDDSQINSLEGEFPFEHTTEIKTIFNEKFDYIFVCRSPEWSPPHLSSKFEDLVRTIYKDKTA